MHYLVTGSAGFLGSHVVEHLLRDGHRIAGIDNFAPCYPRELKKRNLESTKAFAETPECFTHLDGDISQSETFDELAQQLNPQDLDGIIHLAGKSGGSESIRQPSDFIKTNLIGTQQLLDFAQLHGIEKFLFASSANVYGRNTELPWKEDDMDLRPLHPDAAIRRSIETLGEIYSNLHAIEFISLRIATAYGPRQRPQMAVHHFVDQIHKGNPIPVVGRKNQTRDYIYIDDVVEAILAATRHSVNKFEIFNIGSNTTTSLDALIAALEHILGIKCELDHRPEPEGAHGHMQMDCGKAAQLLGFRAKTTLLEGLRKYCEWYGQEFDEKAGV